jgi:hypothetical protein
MKMKGLTPTLLLNVVLATFVNYAHKIVNWGPKILMKLTMGQV